jgi:hypothetical protein
MSFQEAEYGTLGTELPAPLSHGVSILREHVLGYYATLSPVSGTWDSKSPYEANTPSLNTRPSPTTATVKQAWAPTSCPRTPPPCPHIGGSILELPKADAG